jgi:uncharacterized protein (DUF58 family)
MARRRSLTTRGVLALALAPCSALAGVLLGAEELVLLAIALGTLLVCGLVQCASRAGRATGRWRVAVDLAASEAEVGEALALRVTVAATGTGAAVPVWLEQPQHCWARVPRHPTRPAPLRRPNPSLVVRVPRPVAETPVVLSFTAPTSVRGVFALRGLRLWCFDSFGLLAQQVAAGPRATITVHPAPVAVTLDDELLRGVQADEAQPLMVSPYPRRDSFGDFSGIRSYIPGDRLRLLYWPALARSGELMVRDFEDAGSHRVHVLADVRPALGEPGCERVLAAVAGIGLQILARGSVVELSTTAGEWIAIGPGPHGAPALLRAIAAIEAGPFPPPPGWRTRHRRLASTVVHNRELHPVAGTPLVVTTDGGAPSLPASFVGRHLVVVS